MEYREFLDRALQPEAPWFVRSSKLDLQDKKVELEIGVKKGWRWKDSEGCAAQVHGWKERECGIRVSSRGSWSKTPSLPQLFPHSLGG